MQKFSFKLQPLLKYRKYLEHLAKQETAKAYKDVKDCEKNIEYLKKIYSEKENELYQKASRGISALDFRYSRDYLDSIENDIKTEISRLAQLKTILMDRQKTLTKKSVDKKVIERLKQKKENDYMDEFRKNEQKEADEIASLKKARQIRESVL